MVITFTVLAGGTAQADGLFVVHQEEGVCREVATYGVGLALGSGTLVVPEGPGPVAAAYLEWVGADDDTPNLKTTPPEGDSTLTVNGIDVVGTQAAGEAGAAELHPGEWWFSWTANVGPDGYDLLQPSGGSLLEISGWDTDELHEVNRNGALLTVIYDTSPCPDPVNIEVLSGVDFFYSGYGRPVSSTIVAPVTQSEHPGIANVVLSHWGTDSRIGVCRTMALWSLAGSGPEPDPDDLPLITPAPDNGEASSANGSLEILQNPFFNPDANCDQQINPVPDAPYEEGHPYPDGAATSPYRLLAVSPDDGGYRGAQTSLIELELLVPPGTTWVAFQLESEGLNIGESGAWGGGFRVLSRPAAAIGDRVWVDENNNGIQENDEPGLPAVGVRLLDPVDLTVVKETTTDDDGTYLFAGDAGCFIVEFDLPDGYSFSPPNAGNDDDVDSNVITSNPQYGRSDVVCVDLDGFDYTIDAGVYRPPSGLGDLVWTDENRNGIQDPGEQGVPNVLVRLVDADGATMAETRTDGNGNYGFYDLEPDQYRVTFEVPPGFSPAPLSRGTDEELDSDATVELLDAIPPGRGNDQDGSRDGSELAPPAAGGTTAFPQPEAVNDSEDAVWIATRWIPASPGVFHGNLDVGLVLQPVTTTTTTTPSTSTTQPTTTTTPETSTTTVPSTASTTTSEPPKRLAFTGSEAGTLALLGILLLGNGLSVFGLQRQ
ncbi:MAG: MSCRAMM family adhesin SdrC, partial [Acidimicrobiia bacterium]|nr:MSCRAMM family adhesin SdrC [Acidimicrobiia bacterium]